MHVLAFGDLEAELWGVCWLPGDESVAQLAMRSGATGSQLGVTLRAGDRSEAWTTEGEGVSLQFVPAADAGPGRDPEGRLTTEGQLCQVSGRATLDGHEIEVDCLGWRTAAAGEPGAGGLDSFRFLAGWLEADFGFSLLALRPGRARGHDADAVAAVVLEDPAPPPVIDPRLSTTYTDAGLPRQAGLELWLEETEEEAGEDEDPGSPQYPRRAAGRVAGEVAEWTQGEFELHAALLHWHSHGREGPGVYVLGQRR